MYSSGGGSSIGRWGWGMVAFASEPNTLSWDNEKHTTSVSMSCPHPWDKHQIKERVHVSVYVWRNDDNNRYSWDNGACACIVASFLPHLASPSKLNGRSLGMGGGKWFGCTGFFLFLHTLIFNVSWPASVSFALIDCAISVVQNVPHSLLTISKYPFLKVC